MKVHYFEQEQADEDDFMLKMAKQQGYVPLTCLLGGRAVMGLINVNKIPCDGCNCDKNKCKGKELFLRL